MDELLSASDTAEREQINNAELVTETDREAIRTFCEAYIGRDELSAKTKQDTKALKAQSAQARARLEEWMRENGVSCAVLPRSELGRLETLLSKDGLPSLPPYIRMKRNNCDRAITAEVVDAAFRAVSRDGIAEQGVDEGPVALCNAIVDAVRRSVRSFKEQCTLSDSLERGKKPVQVPEVPAEIAGEAFTLHASFARAKAARSVCKAFVAPRETLIKQQQPVVESVLDKLCVSSQQVEVGGAPYRLVKRSSTTKPKITLNVLAEVLAEVLASEVPSSCTKEGACALWESSRDTLLRATLMRIAALPASRNSKVILQRVRADGGAESEASEEEED